MMFRYLPSDLAFFVGLFPCLSISMPGRATRFLSHMVPVLEAHQEDLRQFPDVQIEPLAFWYATLRALGVAHHPGFIHDLIMAPNWQYRAVASWLCAISPHEAHLKIAATAPKNAHQNNWGLDMMVNELEGRPVDPSHEQVYALILRARAYMAHVEFVDMPLRHVSLEHEAMMDAARQVVKTAYLTGGKDAAFAALRQTPAYEYIMPYPQWYRMQQPTSR